MESKKVNVLGVGIDDVSLSQAVEIVKGWLNEKSKKKHYIVTPNPEFIMAAQSDLDFKDILNKADLAIPDGAGLKLSGKMNPSPLQAAGYPTKVGQVLSSVHPRAVNCEVFSLKIKNTVAGVDLLEKLCELSSKQGFTVGFLGGRDMAAKKAAECLQKKYPGLKIAFAEDGGEVDKNGNVIARKFTLSECNESNGRQSNMEDPHVASLLRMTEKVDLLFVGFGAVKQEKWIAKNLEKLSVKVAMGVGGSFDEISGKVIRCPKWIQQIGLKWLFRLILEPWRIKRQLQLIKFVLLVKK